MAHQGESLWNMSLVFEEIIFDSLYYRLTGDQVNSKRLLSSWTLHFAAKKAAEVV